MTITVEKDFKELTSIRPDKQGRFALSNAVKVVEEALGGHADTFKVCVSSSGEILLIPIAEIPLRELWLHQNPEAKASVLRGLDQLARGEISDMEDFSQYLDEAAVDEE